MIRTEAEIDHVRARAAVLQDRIKGLVGKRLDLLTAASMERVDAMLAMLEGTMHWMQGSNEKHRDANYFLDRLEEVITKAYT